MMRGLEIHDLSVQVDDKLVLDGVSLSVGPNEVCGLVGANGSGKSSLLATIMGLSGYQIISGEITFNGQLLNNLSPDQRALTGIGLMFQKPPVFKGLTFLDLLSKLDESFDLGQFELDVKRLLGRPLNQGFSGGELKRSELLQLIHQQPHLALFDEPDSGVDTRSLQKIELIMQGFLANRSGLIISHNRQFLDKFKIARIYRLDKGRLADAT